MKLESFLCLGGIEEEDLLKFVKDENIGKLREIRVLEGSDFEYEYLSEEKLERLRKIYLVMDSIKENFLEIWRFLRNVSREKMENELLEGIVNQGWI